MKTIDEIRDAFLRIHRVAIGTSERSYMSIPADRERDADLILSDAIDELKRLREKVDAEPARTAAAVAAAREETVAACAVEFERALAEGESFTLPGLTTPLADRIAELEAERDRLAARIRQLESHNLFLATTRDALRAQVEAARTYARQSLDYGEDCDATDLLAAMDGAMVAQPESTYSRDDD